MWSTVGSTGEWECPPCPHGDRAACGTYVLEAAEGQLRSGRLRYAGPPPSAVARSLQGRLDSWHRRRWRCQESGALARRGQNNERPAQPHTSPTRDLGHLLPFTLGPEQPRVSSASAKTSSFSSHWEPRQLPTRSLSSLRFPPHHEPGQFCHLLWSLDTLYYKLGQTQATHPKQLPSYPALPSHPIPSQVHAALTVNLDNF